MSAVDTPHLEPPPPPHTRARKRWFVRVLALIGVLVLVIAAGLAWLLQTQGGARFVLERVARVAGEGVKIEGAQGSLGGVIRIALIEVNRPGIYARIEDFRMETSLVAPLRGHLLVHDLGARKVEVRTASTGAAAQVPVSFAPPYAIELQKGTVGELRLGVLTPEAQAEKDPARKRALMDASSAHDIVVKDIFLSGSGDERHWRIEEARADTPYGKGSLGGTVETKQPFKVVASALWSGTVAERAYKATINANGTLKSLEAKLDGELSGQKASARLVLEPFATMPVRVLELTARDVDLAQQGLGPATQLTLDVKLAAAEGKSFAGPVRVENARPGPWDRGALPFSHANARVAVTSERVDIADLEVALAGGGGATGRVRLEKNGVTADLRVADVDLAALHGALQKTRVTGRVGVSGDRAAQKFDVALKDPRFSIEGRAALANKKLDVETARVNTGGGAVTATGSLALAGRREFRFEGRAEHFDPSAFVKSSKGDLNFTFTTQGTLEGGVAGEARVAIAPSTLAQLPAGGRIEVSGDLRRIAAADIDVTLGESRLAAKGSFGRPGDAMDVIIHAPNLSVLSKPFGVALAGRADATGRITGTFAVPAGRVELTGGELALPGNVFMRTLTAKIEAGADPESAIEAKLDATGAAMGKDSPPTTLAETLTVSVRGKRAAHRIELAAKMNRDNDVQLAMQGGLDPRAKTLAWNGSVDTLRLTGRGAFSLVQRATLSASAARVELGDARLKGEWGEVHLETTRWTPRTLDVKGSSAGVQVQNLARSLRLGDVPRSTLVVAGNWDIHAAETFEGTVELRRLSGDLRVGEPPLPLGLQDLTLKANAVRGRANATLAISGERVGKVSGEGSGQIVRGEHGWTFAADAPVQAHLVATHTNLESFTPWLGPDSRLGGRFDAEVNVTGTGADPRVSGRARASGLVLREPQTGFELEQGVIAVRLDGKSIAIDELAAVTPWHMSEGAREKISIAPPPNGGRISADGSIDMGARSGAIRLKLDHVPVTQLATRFVSLSGEARLEAGKDGLLAAGTLNADAGWVGALANAPPSVADDVVVVRASTPAEEGAKREPIHVDVKLALGDQVYFQGRGLDTRLEGEIRLTGTPGPGLRASGTIKTAGGTYDGYGQKLTIERGVLTFAGPVDNPRLNVLALRKGLPVEAGVEVLGTTTRPRVRLVSNPDVPEPEKLSWLVLGRSASDASLGDSAVMMAAARALLGNNNPGSDLTKKLGFDEIRIGRSDTNSVLGVLPQSTVAGRTGTSSAADVISVGRRINDQVHLTYQQGLSDAEGSLKLTWKITQQFQLLARAGYQPGLDAVYRWTFK